MCTFAYEHCHSYSKYSNENCAAHCLQEYFLFNQITKHNDFSEIPTVYIANHIEFTFINVTRKLRSSNVIDFDLIKKMSTQLDNFVNRMEILAVLNEFLVN